MNSRRNFLSKSALATLGLALGACKSEAGAQDSKQMKAFKPTGPIILSTWHHGIAANAEAARVIKAGGSAVDGAEAGVMIPEADPDNTSVGYGGAPDRDGNVTLDACIMDSSGNAGSVCFLQHIKHPIAVARKVMDDTPHVMLSGAGALRFALANGFEKQNLLTPKSKEKWDKWLSEGKYQPIINVENHDTIGLLAMDMNGDIAGACTTSGLAYKMHGRVGDSPVIGAGLFVDNEVGGATATGMGEAVLKTMGSFLVVELMRNGMSPNEACKEAVMRIVKKQDYKNFQIGYIAMNKQGETGSYCIHPGFNYALYKDGGNELHDAISYAKE